MVNRFILPILILLFCSQILFASSNSYLNNLSPETWTKEYLATIANRKFISLSQFQEDIDQLMKYRNEEDEAFKAATKNSVEEGIILLRPQRMNKILEKSPLEGIRTTQELNDQLFKDGSRVFTSPTDSSSASEDALPAASSDDASSMSDKSAQSSTSALSKIRRTFSSSSLDSDRHISLNEAYSQLSDLTNVALEPASKNSMKRNQIFRQFRKENFNNGRPAMDTVLTVSDTANRVLGNAALVAGSAVPVVHTVLNAPSVIQNTPKLARAFTHGVKKTMEAKDIAKNWGLPSPTSDNEAATFNFENIPSLESLDSRYGISDAKDIDDVWTGMRKLASDKNLISATEFKSVLSSFENRLQELESNLAKGDEESTGEQKSEKAIALLKFNQKKTSMVNEFIQILRPGSSVKKTDNPALKAYLESEHLQNPERGTLNTFAETLLDKAAKYGVEVREPILKGLTASQVQRSLTNWRKNGSFGAKAKTAADVGLAVNSVVATGATIAGASALTAVTGPVAFAGVAATAIPLASRSIKGLHQDYKMKRIVNAYRDQMKAPTSYINK